MSAARPGATATATPNATPVPVPAPGKAGRHRDPAADEAILNATLDLLRERGYNGLSVAAVIERAGVGSATLYRRYPTKVDLVVAALQCVVVERVDTDTGTLHGDVAAFIRQSAAGIAARAEFARISVDISADPQLSATFKEKLLAPRLSELNGILHRAADRGEMSKAKVPSPDVAFSLVIGPVYHRALVLQEPLTPAFLKAAANAAYAGLVGVPSGPGGTAAGGRAKA